MARLNISIPDALHERLERLRERMNLSEVCTVALDRAAATIEAQPTGDDPLVAQMLQRLQTTHDVWRRRGEEDGRRWAAERATLDELRRMSHAIAYALYLNFTASVGEDEPEPGTPLPETFSLSKAIDRWVGEDARGGDYNARSEATARVEYLAYLEGWLKAVGEMWALTQKVVR